MRFRRCSYQYSGHLRDSFPRVSEGTILISESSKAKATLLEFERPLLNDQGDKDGKGRMVPVDLIADATIKDGRNGTFLLSGISALAEGEFGLAEANVTVEITPLAGCKGCGQ